MARVPRAFIDGIFHLFRARPLAHMIESDEDLVGTAATWHAIAAVA